MDEGFDRGWGECREKMLTDFKVYFPNSDLGLIDPNRDIPEPSVGDLPHSLPPEQLSIDTFLVEDPSKVEAGQSEAGPVKVNPPQADLLSTKLS